MPIIRCKDGRSDSPTIGSTSLTSCYGSPDGWEFTTNYTQQFSYTRTADASSTQWEVDFNVEMTDPDHSPYTELGVDVYVTHNGIRHQTAIYYHSAAGGDVSCTRPYGYFSAQTGDTFEIVFSGSRATTSAHAKVDDVRIYRF